MRSPFYYFRKYQKVLLAVFGVALMIAFVVGGTVLQFMGSGGVQVMDDTPVVTFDGGSLTESEMVSLRRRHNAVRAYLSAIVNETFSKGGTPGTRRLRMTGDSDAELLHSYLMARKAEEMGIVITDEAIEDFLLELADGKITLEGLDKIRKERFGNDISFNTLVESLRHELAARSVEEQILSGLATRSETRGEQYAIEPSRAWEYFGHLNREITAEVLPLKVEDFVKDVPEPTEEQYSELFEEFKHDYAFPNSADPGFKQRHRIALAYVKADFQKFLGEEKAKVTDEEIEKYYNENINDFRKPELPPERDTTTTESDASEPGDPAEESSENEDAEGDDTQTGSEDGSTTDAEEKPPAADDTAVDEPVETSPPPAGDSEPEAPVEEAPTDGPPPPTASGNDDEPAEGDNESPDDATNDTQSPPPSPNDDTQFRLPSSDAAESHYVALLADVKDEDPANSEAKSEAAADPAGNETASEPADGAAAAELELAPAGDATTSGDETEPESASPEAPVKAASDAADTPDQSSAGAADKATGAEATDTTEPAGESEEDSADGTAATDAPPDGETVEPEPPPEGETAEPKDPPQVEYRPLEEVRDEIRETLALKPAQQRLDEALSTVLERTHRYAQERGLWEVEKQDDPDLPAPAPPNLKPYLDEFGMTSGEIPEVDVVEIADHEIGKAQHTIYVETQPGRPRQPRTITLASEAYVDGLPLYQPKRFPPSTSDTDFSTGAPDQQFVYWKISETPKHVPELKDVRELVIEAWKKREAVKLAQKAAEKKAEQAREAGLSLVSKFGEENVTETGKFNFYDYLSRLMARMGQGRLQISNVEGVEQPGRKFMRTVFNHEAGDVFTATNEPETYVYVMRIKTDQPDQETLRNNFKESLTQGPEPGLPYEVQLLAQQDVGALLVDWIEDYKEQLDVQWQRDPEPGSQGRS